MARQFNGVFREWMNFKMPDDWQASVIWGHCRAFLSDLKSSGKVIHPAKISKITKQGTAATMNPDPGCKICHGTGLYDDHDGHHETCTLCCKHTDDWWQLEGCYWIG